MNALKWSTEQRMVCDLTPTDYNPRKRNEAKQQKLHASIDKFNLVEIPVINLDNHIIAGQRRWESYADRGRLNELIDVRVPSRMLTEDEVKEYMLISNTHAGEWDLIKLEENFSDIYKDIIVELPSIENESLPSEEQVTQKQDSERLIVEDEFNELPPVDPISQKDDLYELGPHRLICGDSTDVNVIGRLMSGALAHMVFTDPPYNLAPETFSGFGKNKTKGFEMGVGEMSEEQFIDFLKKAFEILIKYSVKGSIHYICMDWKHIYEIRSAGRLFSEFKNMIVWNKSNGGMGTFYRGKYELIFMFQNNQEMPEKLLESRIDDIENHGYESSHELIFIFKNGREKHINNFMLGQSGRYRTNVWDYPGANSFNKTNDVNTKDHPTPKPIKLVADAIMDCSLKGNIILDVFSGSGTTLISAEQTDRICYAAELDPSYCDLNIRRYIRFMRNSGANVKIKKNGKFLTKEELKQYELR